MQQKYMNTQKIGFTRGNPSAAADRYVKTNIEKKV
jgi:hypothetical protein